MAAEMSCLTGVDAEDKDADPEINALMLMQEPLRMTSCTDAFSKSLGQPNSVLDVLSSEDMLSPVGLGNGPSVHQPTEAHELNNFSNDKEEEKNITPLKTVQEIGGIWDFDIDSPEDSSDNFNSPSNIPWDSQKELMQFLWDSHGDSPGEEPKEEAPPADIPKRRKRKMDMVVMVDPSEELFPPEDQQDDIPVIRVRKPRISPSRTSPSRTVTKYTNGTTKPIKHFLYSSPASNSKQNNINHEFSPLKSQLTINSYSEEPQEYPCTKCKIVFKKKHLLDYHMRSHTEQLKPYVCKECGKSFKKSGFLIEHMAVHKPKLTVEKKSSTPQWLYCPQCSFGTTCANKFVDHAKTHQKFKRKIMFSCEKCHFKTEDEAYLRKHIVTQHSVPTPKKHDEKPSFTCNICCSYKTFSKLVFTKHLLRRHDQSLVVYEAKYGTLTYTQKPLTVSTSKSPLKNADFPAKISIESQKPTKVLSHNSSNISDLFKNDKIRRGPGLYQIESKLDKSINELLSRQKKGPTPTNQRKETNGNTSEKDPYELPESPLSENDQVQSESDLDPSYSPRTRIVTIIQNKTYSKRKLATSLHNTSEEDSILPNPSSPKGMEDDEDDFEKRDLSPFRDIDNNHVDSIFKRQKQIIYTYSRRMSMRGALQASKKLYEKIKSEENDQSDVEIKDEDTDEELVIENESVQPQNPIEELQAIDPSCKNCPYCSAVFESGVGLSNHIRGHLHRIGLNYKARHKVSAEAVATTEEKPSIGQRISTLMKKRELQQNTDSETEKEVHSCPLCGYSFESRTGQANHIRGHLKKLGKSLISKHKSPILLLQELMRDKNEYQRALDIIGKNNHIQYNKASSKLSDFQTVTPRFIDSVKDDNTDTKPPKLSFDDIISEKGQLETNSDIKTNSALIGILKKRKCQEDGEQISGTSSLPHSIPEKDGFKRKSCIHCSASFHSGVSLSNHLRACARRKRNGLPDGSVLDGKTRRQQMRPGTKKKVLPQPQTPEEMYCLTCRFCDLVFQGPLSVQEDWVKHLQRHIMNTSVPHTGLAMVEVSSVPIEPFTRKYEQDGCTSAPC
ncbi:zinc finger protein 644a [Eucyclogobius newberryi]|uniref:zinc finger protein 644a n=1 Tax=Eucyclogobius newberryi TaxID=166745 RepID=UPI003B59BE16